jgi:hypothetical protein
MEGIKEKAVKRSALAWRIKVLLWSYLLVEHLLEVESL